MRIRKSKEFGEINLQDLVDFESRNEIKLPDDYKEFLMQHNGGEPMGNVIHFENNKSSDVQYIFGIHNGPYHTNFLEHVGMFQGRIPSWYIPVARDSGGNLYLMSVWEENSGAIAFWDHRLENEEGDGSQYFDSLSFVANSFTVFLNNLT